MSIRPVALALMWLPCAGALEADVIHLKNGKTIEGTASPGAKPGTLEIRTGEGTVVQLPESDIERIEKKTSPIDELEARAKALPPGELEPLADLLVWARDKQLFGRVKALAKKILDIDPNNELARKELGYVVFENRWILEAELKKKKDLVRHHGEWMTQPEKDRRVATELAQEMEDLLTLVSSESPHIQEFAFHKLLSIKSPSARAVFGAHLKDPREAARWVAVRGLAGFPVKGAGDAEAAAIAAELHRLALEDTSDKAFQVLLYTLRRFHPRESLRLATETARDSRDGREMRRAAEVVARLTAEREKGLR